MMRRVLRLAFPLLFVAAMAHASTFIPGTPGATTAVAQIGPSTGTISVTTSDAPTTLTLPGKVRFVNPQFLINTTTANTTPLQVNYTGGNACTAPNVTLSPGQIDDWVFVPTTTQPHVCAPAAVTVEAQQ